MAAPARWHTLQEPVPLRDSMIWDLQTVFYDRVNIDCWAQSIVPNFVTSNCFIGHAYTRALLGFIRDWYLRSPAAAPDEPIYIIEVGVGHGKMSFHMMNALTRLREYWPRGVARPFVYVMTDFTQNNVDFWRAHPSFQAWMEEGILDMALFDADNSASIKLQVSGKELGVGSCANPVLAICNYIFDTLRQDAFRIVDGQLQEALIGVQSPREEPEAVHPDVIARMRCYWEYRDCKPEIYENKAMQAVLKAYLAQNRNMSILIPVGGIGVINRLATLSNGRVMLLAGDKAYNHDMSLAGLRDPHIAKHGSFSFMVNFDAVRLNVVSRGGFSLRTPYLDGFKCSAFCIGCGKPSAYPELRVAWKDYFMRFGPENFSTLQRCVKDESGDASLKTALTVLRLSRYDSDIFFKFRSVFVQRAPEASEKLIADTVRDLKLMYANYYPLQKNKDIGFELAHLLMTLHMYEEAVQYFKNSQRDCGEHYISWYNMGICYHYLEEPVEALKCFTTVLELQPNYHDAVGWKRRAALAVQELEKTKAQEAAAGDAGGVTEADVELHVGGEGGSAGAGTGVGDGAGARAGAGAGAGAGSGAGDATDASGSLPNGTGVVESAASHGAAPVGDGSGDLVDVQL